MSQRILIANGPNLNLLGERQPELYGRQSLADIERLCRQRADTLGFKLDFRQTNSESALIEMLHEARGSVCGVIINAAALSHTSLALLDALLAFEGVVVELHLTNIHRRESFRRRSYLSRAADGIVCGFGAYGYVLAMEGARALLAEGSSHGGG